MLTKNTYNYDIFDTETQYCGFCSHDYQIDNYFIFEQVKKKIRAN
jgi:hypothetical protein